jgi:hypothetical protein
MASGNPTLDVAEASTGIEPLNSGPSSPQPPQHAAFTKDPTIDNIPPALQKLHAPFSAFVLPLSTNQRTSSTNSYSISTEAYPNDSQLEDIVKSTLHPEGPVRAEQIKPQDVRWPDGYREVIKHVESLGAEPDVMLWKVVRGQKKAEIFVVSLDVDGERLVGVRFEHDEH